MKMYLIKEGKGAEKKWVHFESKEGGYLISHPDYEVKKTDRVGYLPELGEYNVQM